ncbi:MAG: 30S ribosomal protein S6 [Actinomycetota bacterium]|nr:30S ribosomal protein S6 [Actinomycetota bacterium]
MRDYEIMLILDPTLEKEAIEKIIKKVENLIKKYKGKVEQVDKWGRRKLVYPILEQVEGYYLVIKFRGIPETIAELHRVSKLTDEVMRYIIVRRAKT